MAVILGGGTVTSGREARSGSYEVRRRRMAADRDFTQISNRLFRDSRLSAKAMGVFGHISTHRAGFRVTPESISRHMRDGVSAIKGALRELETCGYLVRYRERREDGTLGGAVYEITDEPGTVDNRRSEPADGIEPQVVADNMPVSGESDTPRPEPAVGNPPVEKPPVENRPHKNTKGENTKGSRTNQPAPAPPQPGWLDGEPPPSQPPSDIGERFLLSLPIRYRPAEHAIHRLASRAEALLAGVWSPEDLTRHLTDNLDGARSPVGVLITRLERLPLADDNSPRSARPQWCRQCDEHTRQRETADRRPYRCPECHPAVAAS